jgi:hypothetical protein
MLALTIPSASVAAANFMSDCDCEVSVEDENPGGGSADWPLTPEGSFGGSGTLVMTIEQEHDGRCWLGEEPCISPGTWCNIDFTLTITISPTTGDPVPDHIRVAGQSFGLSEIGNTGIYTGTTAEMSTPNLECDSTFQFHVKVRAGDNTVLTDNVIMIRCDECLAGA